MNEEFKDLPVEKDDILVAMLRQSQALPPPSFAVRTAAVFAVAAARRQTKRVVALCAGLFIFSSVVLWLLVLNIQNVAGSAWLGVKATLATVGFIYTIWQRLPFTCGAITLLLFAVSLLTVGLLGKVTSGRVLVK